MTLFDKKIYYYIISDCIIERNYSNRSLSVFFIILFYDFDNILTTFWNLYHTFDFVLVMTRLSSCLIRSSHYAWYVFKLLLFHYFTYSSKFPTDLIANSNIIRLLDFSYVYINSDIVIGTCEFLCLYSVRLVFIMWILYTV